MAVDEFKKSVFEAISIDEVIWIDDRFHEDSSTIDDTYYDTIQAAFDSDREKLENFEDFKDIDWDTPIDILIEQKEFPVNSEVIHRFLSYMSILESDYTENEFSEIDSLLQELASTGTTHKLSGNSWAAKSTEFVNTGKCYLILVDINFEKEGLPANHGEDLIKQIITEDNFNNSYCVLFTSETQIGQQEEERRKAIIDSLGNTEFHHFSVLSKMITQKEQSKEVCIQFKTIDFIRRIFLRKLSVGILNNLTENLISNLETMRKDLGKYSIYEINKSIFKKSLDEGASEVELLSRFISIMHHQTVFNTLSRNEEIIRNLVKFRSVQSVELNGKQEKYIDNLHSPTSELHNLRMSEIFDSTINSFHSPLSVGDIFKFEYTHERQSETKEYIVISQPCDLMVRGDSTRNRAHVTLIEFVRKEKSKSSIQKDEGKPHFYFVRLPSTENKSNCLEFDFRNARIVNANLLDMSVFNKDGSLCFESNTSISSLIYLPGWIKRFDNLKSAIVDVDTGQIKEQLPSEFQTFTLIPEPWFEVTKSNGSISLKGQRIERLRSPFVDDIMRKYFIQYLNRFAFEKDFTEQ